MTDCEPKPEALVGAVEAARRTLAGSTRSEFVESDPEDSYESQIEIACKLYNNTYKLSDSAADKWQQVQKTEHALCDELQESRLVSRWCVRRSQLCCSVVHSVSFKRPSSQLLK